MTTATETGTFFSTARISRPENAAYKQALLATPKRGNTRTVFPVEKYARPPEHSEVEKQFGRMQNREHYTRGCEYFRLWRKLAAWRI